MILDMDRKTRKPANNAGLLDACLWRICLPRSLIRNTRNSASSWLLSAAISQTVTQAILATGRRLKMAKADSCCHASSMWPADLAGLKKHSICPCALQVSASSARGPWWRRPRPWRWPTTAIAPTRRRRRPGCGRPPTLPAPERRGQRVVCLCFTHRAQVAPQTAAWPVASLGSKQPVCQPGISATSGRDAHRAEHEPKRQLLG